MRRKITAGVLLTLAFLVPASSASAAPAASPSVTEASCPAVVVFQDIRELVTIDLGTASDSDVRGVADQILTAANSGSLPGVSRAVQPLLDRPDELRAFLKTNLQSAWKADLRFAVYRTLTTPGPSVQAAAEKVLSGTGAVESYLAYLNIGQYTARAADAGSLRLYTDVRTLVDIDPETAEYGAVRLLAYRLLEVTAAESLGKLTAAIDAALAGSNAELRAFFKTDLQAAWSEDLADAVTGTLPTAGSNVQEAAQKALANGTTDSLFTYLNSDLYVARARDCVYQAAA